MSSSSIEVDITAGRKPLTSEEKKFGSYLTVLRFLPYCVTSNLKRIYLDFEVSPDNMVLTAFYEANPNALDLHLLDEIVIKASSHIKDFSIENKFKLMKDLSRDEKHDYTVFAVYNEA